MGRNLTVTTKVGRKVSQMAIPGKLHMTATVYALMLLSIWGVLHEH